MQNYINEMVEHMAQSSAELARILEAEKHVAVRMSDIVQVIPDLRPSFDGGVSAIVENSLAVSQNLVAYLNSIADLQETIASHLSIIIRELKVAEEE
ncbi:nucleoside-diphosphate sugar epimerase [Paenibacillus sp. 2TAB19]|uniref:nucleoside-diphosphate sugar epimerase n=1 Tax=Paenibacillus sp. 2TAB19 TaxID=3233003 RepID=UPI003F9B9DC2